MKKLYAIYSYVLRTWEFCLHEFVYHICAWFQERPEAIKFPGTGVVEGYGLPHNQVLCKSTKYSLPLSHPSSPFYEL